MRLRCTPRLRIWQPVAARPLTPARSDASMKPKGKRDEECANHEEVSGLEPRVVSLNSGKLTHRLSNLAIAFVDEPTNSDQDGEDDWNGDAALG